MKTCIILHSMIIGSENSQDINLENWKPQREEIAEDMNLEHAYSFPMSMINN